ncbi:HIT-like protein [Cylindrobasidium torrendii FP15055 ss-10]|uniref:HIT-like protein n=1 Tax=Cylindrobasidium torrendii FP15055 ss-10 TaxID=1314674 RepID=A0A0D7AZK7_9AGAR|nr:HIT-like protein [Cylindrobasidium torrendii FP15055 ss-10]
MSLEALNQFVLDQVLNEEPEKKQIALLGTFPAAWTPQSPAPASSVSDRLRAIVRIEKTAISSSFSFSQVSDASLTQSTDIYSWLALWLKPTSDSLGDAKVDIIFPATDDHVRKYSPQKSLLVRETPELYASITKPYIDAFPPERTKWVTKILDGESEQEAVLFNCPEYLILPDMKWDLHTLSSLYLVAISRDPTIRSLRDLRVEHVPLLKSIRDNAYEVVRNKWDMGPGSLRMWIHYQPSYYHFHVHIASTGYEGAGFGMAVGQAHLLDDVISLLESTADTGINIFSRMTLTYGLGEQHRLYEPMVNASLK